LGPFNVFYPYVPRHGNPFQNCLQGTFKNFFQNGAEQNGFSNILFNIRDGLRLTSAEAYLSLAAQRQNLHIAIESQVGQM
jgi:hypothetical protein